MVFKKDLFTSDTVLSNLNNMGKQFALNNNVSLFWKIIYLEAEFPLVIFFSTNRHFSFVVGITYHISKSSADKGGKVALRKKNCWWKTGLRLCTIHYPVQHLPEYFISHLYCPFHTITGREWCSHSVHCQKPSTQ